MCAYNIWLSEMNDISITTDVKKKLGILCYEIPVQCRTLEGEAEVPLCWENGSFNMYYDLRNTALPSGSVL